MDFGRSIISPAYNRQPDFISWLSKKKTFGFTCVNCESAISFGYEILIGKEWTWKTDFGESSVSEIKRFYKMNIVGKSPDGGWPAVTNIHCQACLANYLIYAGVIEASNSCYIVTLQGITEFLDSPDL